MATPSPQANPYVWPAGDSRNRVLLYDNTFKHIVMKPYKNNINNNLLSKL